MFKSRPKAAISRRRRRWRRRLIIGKWPRTDELFIAMEMSDGRGVAAGPIICKMRRRNLVTDGALLDDAP